MGLGKKKSSSGSRRISETIDGKSFHLATHQRLYHSSLLYTVYRHTLEPQDKFSAEKGLQLLQKHHRKKQAECIACLLEDRMVLEKTARGKEPFRTWVAYKEIVDMRVDPKRKDMFVLMINSQTSNARYYEVYRCTPKDNITHYERIIRKGMEDPEGIARTEAVEGIVQVNEETDRPRTLANYEYQNSSEFLEEEDIMAAEKENNLAAPINYTKMENKSPSPPLMVKQSNVSAAPMPVVLSTPVELKKRTTQIAWVQTSPEGTPITRTQPVVLQQTRPPSQPEYTVAEEILVHPQIQKVQKQHFTPSPKSNYWPTSPAVRRRRTIENLEDVTYVNYGSAGAVSDNGRGPVYLYVSSEKHFNQSDGRGVFSTKQTNSYNGFDEDEYDYEQ